MDCDASPDGASAFVQSETPRLILDLDRLEHNAEIMRQRCATLHVALRPHLKTSKSLDVARVAIGQAGAITVSTLKEAAYFAAGGYHDILYATALIPNKMAQLDRIQRETGAIVRGVVDNAGAAAVLARASESLATIVTCLIEIDCGEHRSGTAADGQDLITIAKTLAETPNLRLGGVMSHAGHSYGSADKETIRLIAEDERRAAVDAATRLRAAGFECPIVSVGSTPTILFADHLNGVTEARCGIYLFWDLAQMSRGVCHLDDIAVSVLASVIGHNKQGKSLILDAGALALSKDLGANRFLPDVHYGHVCDPYTLKRYTGLSVNIVHQEHGTVDIPDETWFAQLPIGSLVRILPNHACITCAAYDSYDVVRKGMVVDRWARINGW